ncbi:MAG: hypothetical protein ACJ73L_06465 [Actinomycetes bacterium]
MKRFAVALATSGLLATTMGVGALAQPAFAADGGLSVTIASAGTKKVDVTWADGSAMATGPFDAYLVTLDNEADTTPDTADRSRFVDDAATRTARFEDLNANTSYYATVYAVDYQADGVVVVPPTGSPAGTALGTHSAAYSPLTIQASNVKPLTGTTITLSGTLLPDGVSATGGEEVTVIADTYPPGGGTLEKTAVVSSNGSWSLTSEALTTNTTYWAEYRDEDGVGGWTGRVDVQVRKNITLAVNPGTTVPAGTKVSFSGTLGGDSSLLAGVQVCLQKLIGGAWKSRFCTVAEPDATYLIKQQLGATADGRYRTWSGMGPAYGDSWSKPKKMTTT